jgi:hypothetical protein
VYNSFSAITQFNRTLPKGGLIAVAGAMVKQKMPVKTPALNINYLF